MLAKKCDRCGKYYELYKDNYGHNGVALTSHDRFECLNPNYDKYDLCPECMEKVIEFLKGEENGQL